MVSSIPDPPLGCKASFPSASSLSPGSWGGGNVVRVMKALWWGRCRCWCHFLLCPRCSAGVRWLLWKLVLPRGDLSSAQVTPAALKHCPQLPKCETRLSLPLFSAMFSSSTLERAAHFVTPLEQGRDISGSPPSAHGATFSWVLREEHWELQPGSGACPVLQTPTKQHAGSRGSFLLPLSSPCPKQIAVEEA